MGTMSGGTTVFGSTAASRGATASCATAVATKRVASGASRRSRAAKGPLKHITRRLFVGLYNLLAWRGYCTALTKFVFARLKRDAHLALYVLASYRDRSLLHEVRRCSGCRSSRLVYGIDRPWIRAAR